MQVLQSIRIYTIPRSLRITLLVSALVLIALNVHIFTVGFTEPKNDFWISSGASLLSVILPLVLIGLLFSFSHSGHQALKDRTERLLVHHLPMEFLRISEDSSQSFRLFQPPKWPNFLSTSNITSVERSRVSVEVSYEKNDCVADYRIAVPRNLYDGERILIRLRVEINVYKLNLVLWFAGKHENRVDRFLDSVCHPEFSLTDHAAEEQAKTPFQNTIIGAMKSGFVINRRMIKRQNGDDGLCGVVLIKNLPEDFLWNAAEQLFVGQDLNLMIRALTVETRGDDGVTTSEMFEVIP